MSLYPWSSYLFFSPLSIRSYQIALFNGAMCCLDLSSQRCCFTIGKSLIAWYIGSSAIASSYGAAGGLIVLLFWVYYSAQIFLLGSELTKTYANQHGSKQRRPVSEGKASLRVRHAR